MRKQERMASVGDLVDTPRLLLRWHPGPFRVGPTSLGSLSDQDGSSGRLPSAPPGPTLPCRSGTRDTGHQKPDRSRIFFQTKRPPRPMTSCGGRYKRNRSCWLADRGSRESRARSAQLNSTEGRALANWLTRLAASSARRESAYLARGAEYESSLYIPTTV
jgi:hypothetical protein